MRPRKIVAGTVLTTALALVALPGLSLSRNPSLDRPFDAAALQPVSIPAAPLSRGELVLDASAGSAAVIGPDGVLVDPGDEPAREIAPRPVVVQPQSPSGSVDRPPRETISGWASFYDHGTTAMRLPRGTLVVICGAGGCIERRVTDYGPAAWIRPVRIADLYRPDFFAVCGCPWYAGTTWVTVRIY